VLPENKEKCEKPQTVQIWEKDLCSHWVIKSVRSSIHVKISCDLS
jgi:hypothetical protein